MSTFTETCGCGASLTFDGFQTATASKWRREHRCSVVTPGPCWNQPRDTPTWPNGREIRCDLLAGHEGAHQADRGPLGGTAVWANEGDDQ